MSANVFGFNAGRTGDRAILQLLADFFSRDVHMMVHEMCHHGLELTTTFRVEGMTGEVAFAQLTLGLDRLNEAARANVFYKTGSDTFVSFIIFLTPRRDLALAYDARPPWTLSELAPPKTVVITGKEVFYPNSGIVISPCGSGGRRIRLSEMHTRGTGQS